MSETLVNSNKIELLCSKFKFSNWFAVDCVGRSGGLAIFWKRSFDCVVLDSSNNHIVVQVNNNGSPQWRMSCWISGES